MPYKLEQFLDITFESYNDNDLSPEIESKNDAISIIMPSEISLAMAQQDSPEYQGVLIPVIGSYKLNASELNFGEFKVVVKDLTSGQEFCGNFAAEEEFDLEDDIGIDTNSPDQIEGWFNVNLMMRIPNLPTNLSRFEAIVLYKDLKSNIINYILKP